MLSDFAYFVFQRVPSFQRRRFGIWVPITWYSLISVMVLAGFFGAWERMFPQVGYTSWDGSYVFFGAGVSLAFALLGAFCAGKAYSTPSSYFNPFPAGRKCLLAGEDLEEWLSQNLFFFAIAWGLSSFLTLIAIVFGEHPLLSVMSFLGMALLIVELACWNFSFAVWLLQSRIE